MDDSINYFKWGQLNGSQRNKLKRLMNVSLSPKELSEEIGFSLDQVYRVYVPAGCPHTKDKRGRIQINGEEFKNWYLENYKKRPLEKNQAYCVSCKKVVEIINPEKGKHGRNSYLISKCPNCGKPVTRFYDCKRKKDDQ